MEDVHWEGGIDERELGSGLDCSWWFGWWQWLERRIVIFINSLL